MTERSTPWSVLLSTTKTSGTAHREWATAIEKCVPQIPMAR